MNENSLLDITLTMIAVTGLAYVALRLAATVIPLQIKEKRVVNGLAKLRGELLNLGLASFSVAAIAMAVLLLSLLFSDITIFLEILILLFVVVLIRLAESLYAIYHQQYTPEHKELSRRVQRTMNQERADEAPKGDSP